MSLAYLTLQATVLDESSLYKSAGTHSVEVVPKMIVYELSAKISLKDDIFCDQIAAREPYNFGTTSEIQVDNMIGCNMWMVQA